MTIKKNVKKEKKEKQILAVGLCRGDTGFQRLYGGGAEATVSIFVSKTTGT